MVVIGSGIVTVVSPVHLKNIPNGIEVSESGMTNEVRLMHPSKILSLSLTSLSEFSIMTEERAVQLRTPSL